MASSPSSSLPSSSTMKEQVYSEWRVLPLVTLTSIATIIGSGILALPVTLYSTPLSIFIVFFTFALLAQMAVVYAVVELLQRARHEHLTSAKPSIIEEVSLYSLARLYLHSRFSRILFHFATLLSFIAILVSYGLAGPQAVWQMISPSASASASAPPALVFFAYWFVGTIAVVVWVRQLLPVFGSFTVLKGILFIAVIFIVAALPPSARVTSIWTLFASLKGWRNIAAPFLMSCVALGGLPNTCPVTFNLLPTNPSRGQIIRYRRAVLVAIVVCYLLNIGWVLAVLQVVPRTAASASIPSLTQAYKRGQIATVPLIATLHRGTAVSGVILRAVDFMLEVFIVVSTGVSYFVMSAGMKSFVDGFASDTTRPGSRSFADGSSATLPGIPIPLRTALAYAACFGSILYIVLANPQGLIAALTRFSSLMMNFQAGFMIFIMLFNSRRAVKRSFSSMTGESSTSASGSSDVSDNLQDTHLPAKAAERKRRRDKRLSDFTGASSSVGVAAGAASSDGRASNGKAPGYDSVAPASPGSSEESMPVLQQEGDMVNEEGERLQERKQRRLEIKRLREMDPAFGTIPLIMPAWQSAFLVVTGSTFFAAACLLAAFGPMIGIKLGHE